MTVQNQALLIFKEAVGRASPANRLKLMEALKANDGWLMRGSFFESFEAGCRRCPLSVLASGDAALTRETDKYAKFTAVELSEFYKNSNTHGFYSWYDFGDCGEYNSLLLARMKAWGY